MRFRYLLVVFGVLLLILSQATFGVEDRVTVNVTPSSQALPGLAGRPSAVGSWFGRALPDNPDTSPFPEVVMTPTFFEDGNLIANDSQELNLPHATAHGSWKYVHGRKVHAVFIWLNLSGDAANVPSGFAGSFKVVLEGSFSPSDPDEMTGTLHGYLYPPNMNPLDPDATPVDAGGFTIEQLHRIRPE